MYVYIGSKKKKKKKEKGNKSVGVPRVTTYTIHLLLTSFRPLKQQGFIPLLKTTAVRNSRLISFKKYTCNQVSIKGEGKRRCSISEKTL